MIIPQPEGDLSLNIFVLASEIIDRFKSRKNYVVVEEIMRDFLKKDKKRTPEAFLDALTFLFTVGVIEYKGYKVRLKRNDFTQSRLF